MQLLQRCKWRRRDVRHGLVKVAERLDRLGARGHRPLGDTAHVLGSVSMGQQKEAPGVTHGLADREIGLAVGCISVCRRLAPGSSIPLLHRLLPSASRASAPAALVPQGDDGRMSSCAASSGQPRATAPASWNCMTELERQLRQPWSAGPETPQRKTGRQSAMTPSGRIKPRG